MQKNNADLCLCVYGERVDFFFLGGGGGGGGRAGIINAMHRLKTIIMGEFEIQQEVLFCSINFNFAKRFEKVNHVRRKDKTQGLKQRKKKT